MGDITVLDLFAGCGGLSFGFEELNWNVVAYEMSEKASNVYKKNLTGMINIQKLTVEDQTVPHQVLIGGPPCQPFSIGGNQKGKYDPRDCVPIFIANMKRHRPLIAIMENVENLAGKKHLHYLNQVIQEMKDLGYQVAHRILDASDYGVPQRRKRLFVVAHRGGFNFPLPTCHTPVTVGETLPSDSFRGSTGDLFPNLVLTKSMDDYIERYENKSKCVNPRDLRADRPARTLTCRNLVGCTSDMIRICLDNKKRRQLTTEEAALLQTFPSNYFEGISRSDAMKMIGNSVPPLLSKQIARCVAAYLGQLSSIKKRKEVPSSASTTNKKQHVNCFSL